MASGEPPPLKYNFVWTDTNTTTTTDPEYVVDNDTAWDNQTIKNPGFEDVDITRVEPWEPAGPIDDQEPGTEISGWRCEWDEVACTCQLDRGELEDASIGDHTSRCHQRQPRLWGAVGRHRRIPPEQQVRLWNESLGSMWTRREEWLRSQQPARTVCWTHQPFPEIMGGLYTGRMSIGYPTNPAPNQYYTWDKDGMMGVKTEDGSMEFHSGLDSITVDEMVDMRKVMGEQAKKINSLERKLRKLKRGR